MWEQSLDVFTFRAELILKGGRERAYDEVARQAQSPTVAVPLKW